MKFQPLIKWTGSKRTLSEQIVSFFPKEIDTYYEPFCGSASVLFQLLHSDVKVNKYICNDLNSDLISLFELLKNDPKMLIIGYEKRWSIINEKHLTIDQKKDMYYFIRDNFNKTRNPNDFLFLLRTCVNGLVRYNSKNEFNTSYHFTRNGIEPKKLEKIILYWSEKLNEKNVIFTNMDYLGFDPDTIKENDYMFFDPPYINTKGMYYGGIKHSEFFEYLSKLKCNYSFTFDGKTSKENKTYDVPKTLYKHHIYLENTQKSAFQKLKKVDIIVNESLYIKK